MSLGKFAQAPVSVGASRSLKQRLEAVLYWLPLAAQQPEQDVEYVHQLRVSTRRAGAALKLFKDLLPKKKAKHLKQTLKCIRNAAGEARDHDVYLARLTQRSAEEPALDPLIQQIREQRATAQAKLVQLWRETCNSNPSDSPVESDLEIRQLLKRLHWRGKKSEPNFHKAAVRWLKPIIHDFFSAEPPAEGEPETLHQYRIAAKHVRYALDLLKPALTKAATKAAKKLSQLQDRLGHINDHATRRHTPQAIDASDRLSGPPLGRVQTLAGRIADYCLPNLARRSRSWISRSKNSPS